MELGQKMTPTLGLMFYINLFIEKILHIFLSDIKRLKVLIFDM